MPRYQIATYFFEEEYPSGACFLLFFDDFAFSQVSLGCAAGLASESDKTIGSSASFGVQKSTLAFCVLFVLFFVCSLSVDISMSESGSSVGLSGRGGSLAALGVMAVLSLGMGFGAGVGVTVVLVALTVLVAFAVGAKVSLVCCGPGELVPLAVATLVCFDLFPPLGDASFPLVLVGFRLFFGTLVMVTRVASVRRWT